jgi:acetolactate synthase-1/2/3 large subunit
MNGADSVVQTLAGGGIDICFANPGTSEMHFVAALDKSPIRPVLCLFEGVVTGAADGYGRMAAKPASTLLHLGPGFANGIANLHNARRAATPVVNIVGDHASWHNRYDAPLMSDIQGICRPVSHWLRSTASAKVAASDAAHAVAAARAAPGQIAPFRLGRGGRFVCTIACCRTHAGIRCGDRSGGARLAQRQAHHAPDAGPGSVA